MKKKDSEQRKLAGRNDFQSEQYLRSLLVPLETGQLVDLLVDMGMQDREVAEQIGAAAGGDPANRQLFVRGLGLGTTSESLRDAFSSHGEIEAGVVIADNATGKSRGFGFITFKNVESFQEALQEPSRVIDGIPAFCKPSIFGPPLLTTDVALSRRLYVSGLSPDVSTEMFRSFFRKYGEIEEGFVVHDRETNTSRGFGFVTYMTDGGAKRAIDDPDKILEGRKIIVKNSLPQPKGKEKETQEEPVVTYSPRALNSPPQAIAQQQHQLQSQEVPHPHVSGNEPSSSGIPSTSATATGISDYPVPHPPVSENQPSRIPSTYATAISAYFVPHPHVSRNQSYGIPSAYPTAIPVHPAPHPLVSEIEPYPYGIPSTYPTAISSNLVSYRQVSGNLLYGIPSAYPTEISGCRVLHRHVRGDWPYGIPLVYPTGISVYRPVPHPPVSENQPN